MRKGLVLSAVLHAAVILFAWFGLPDLLREDRVVDEPVVVDVVTLSQLANPPVPAPAPTPEPPVKPVAPTPVSPTPAAPAPTPVPPPPPPPPPSPVPTPAPEPKPEVVKPEVAKPEIAKPEIAKAVEPKPEPVKTAEPKPETPPPPKPLAKPAPPKVKPAETKPEPEKKPENRLATLLSSVNKLRDQIPPEETKPSPRRPQPDQAAPDAPRPERAQPTSRLNDPTRALSASELDAVRQQIARCWNVPAGARNADELIVDIFVVMNSDGTVREARIVNSGRMGSDRYYRSAAESALRAVLNPSCSPLKLPRDKFEVWKTMTLSFNPREMLAP